MLTRFPHSQLVLAVGAAAAALTLAACGSESSDTATPSATAGESGVNVEVGNTINYMSVPRPTSTAPTANPSRWAAPTTR